MQPTTPREFLKVAQQRLSAAEEIAAKLRLMLEAQYIAGYAVECSLKALILEKTDVTDRLEALKKLTRGAQGHRKEVLLGELSRLGTVLPGVLKRRIQRFDWTTDLRYEWGRKHSGETRGLLRTAREMYTWVEAQILL